ncbi:amino acid adenylation domain-containing protein [Streptomyces sp. NPDC088785]|uniref:non-ribosomal peptide synthetase n=1 Tax=Streptomyces sp. NPDC088785 TaxID=3365897 RepID=UPI00380AD4E7
MLARARAKVTDGPRPRQDRNNVPLSYSQNTLWFVDRLQSGTSTYNVQFIFRLEGTLDVAALTAAFASIVQRHEALRTYVLVENDEYFQGFVENPEVVVDKTVAASESEALRMMEELAAEPIGLTVFPLWNISLVEVSEDLHYFGFVVHHIIFDGVSTSIFFEELEQEYNARRSGTLPKVESPAVQFADFSEWQRKRMEAGSWQESVDYWSQTLSGADVMDVPGDRPLPPEVTSSGAACVTVHPELAARVRKLAATLSTTPVTVYATAMAALFQRYSGSQNVIFGMPTANRGEVECERTLGFFINMLPLRCAVDPTETFRTSLQGVQQRFRDGQAHGRLPLEEIIACAGVQRDASRSTLFQYTLTMNEWAEPLRLDGITAVENEPDTTAAKFFQSWTVTPRDGDLEIHTAYNTDIFDRATIATMQRAFAGLLARAAAAPDSTLRQLWAEDEESRAVQAERGRGADVSAPTGNVYAHFRAVAAAHPERLAVGTPQENVTYGELLRRVNAVSAHLAAEGIGRGDRVGVALEPSPDFPATVLALLGLGAVYVPIDAMNPPGRIEAIIEDAELSRVVCDDTTAGVAPGLEHTLPATLPDGERGPGAGDGDGSAVAYLMYTSGSTGTPKGVLIEHDSILGFIQNVRTLFEITPQDRFLGFASCGFDVSVFEMFGALLSGASLHYVPSAMRLDMAAVQRFLAEHRVTVTDLPPSVMKLLDPEPLSDLRIVFVGGEAFSHELVRAWGAGRRIFNGYGVTECTVTSVVEELTEPLSPAALPIGGPMDNHLAYVLDDQNLPVPQGVIGQLAIGGVGLARGYWHRDEDNQRRFIEDPVAPGPGGRLYLTGDLVRHNADGRLVYAGRADKQVKINGVRIEIGEIESVLRSGRGVTNVFVRVQQDEDRKKVVAYVATAGEATETTLREHCRRHLVSTMIPAAFVLLDELPINASGKIDEKALPRAGAAPEAQEAQSFSNVEQQMLEKAFGPILGRTDFAKNVSFFDLGGTSLQAAQLVSKIKKIFATEIPLAVFFADSSVQRMALEVERSRLAALGPEELEQAIEQMTEEDVTRLLAE